MGFTSGVASSSYHGSDGCMGEVLPYIRGEIISKDLARII